MRGQVVDIIPDAKHPGDPIIRVKVTDDRWDASKFGETVDVRSDAVSQAGKTVATLPKKPKPAPSVVGDTGVAPARIPQPNMVVDPDGPNFLPLGPPDDWAQLSSQARTAWVEAEMEQDFTNWRGEPTSFDFTGFDSGVALAVANTYRDLANWDPATARRVDAMRQSTKGSNGLSASAIAVAHPGTDHPGGIGPKVKETQIVLGSKYYRPGSSDWWQNQKKATAPEIIGGKYPWSTSSMTGDGTVTVSHEYGHMRQFRFLETSMQNANKPFADGVRIDGFGMIPDSSNWKETQDLRYAIPKLTQTQYGQSKTSEGYAEAWSERLLGVSSPQLDDTLDRWEEYMGLAAELPPPKDFKTARSWDELSLAEQDQFWQANGKYLELPGMRAHYPQSAADYDEWLATSQTPDRSARINARDEMLNLESLKAELDAQLSGEAPWNQGFMPPMMDGFQDRLGRCYELAGQYLIGHDAELVHGTIQGAGQPPLNHAWNINVDGTIHEPASDRDYTPEAFQKLFNPVIVDRYSQHDAMMRMVESGHFGPWNDPAEVRVLEMDEHVLTTPGSQRVPLPHEWPPTPESRARETADRERLLRETTPYGKPLLPVPAPSKAALVRWVVGKRLTRQQRDDLTTFIRDHGRPSDKTLYRGEFERGSGFKPRQTSGADIHSWSENRKAAVEHTSDPKFVKRLKPGEGFGIRVQDYADFFTRPVDKDLIKFDKEWILLDEPVSAPVEVAV